MFRAELPRWYELRDLITDPNSPDAYFPSFEERLRESRHHVLQIYLQREAVLQGLDNDAWRFLKSEAARWLTSRDPERGWEQLFNFLDQARAYNYLKRLGCSNVRFIPPSTTKTPDLEGSLGSRGVLCEVKTINPSSESIRARSEVVAWDGQTDLSEGFFKKLRDHIAKAEEQMNTYDPKGLARRIVYINPRFDDPFGECKHLHFRQIDLYLLSNPAPGVELVFYNDRTPYYRPITMTNAAVDNALQ